MDINDITDTSIEDRIAEEVSRQIAEEIDMRIIIEMTFPESVCVGNFYRYQFDERHDWLVEHIGELSKSWTFLIDTFFFKNKQDKMLYILRWGA